MKVIVTGAEGMLGSDLCPVLSKAGFKVYPTDVYAGDGSSDILDVADKVQVSSYINKIKPDIVMHLAAETDVDRCEKEPNRAFLINTQGSEHVALACRLLDIPMVFISTGAVFNGEKESGYLEEDAPAPLSVYGKSKLEAENIIKSLVAKHYTIRAGWMIGGYKKDKKFVWKIAQLLKVKKEIPVVIDKFGSPTFTRDFSKGILDIVTAGRYGLYHCVNKGICSRFDIAKKIVEYLNVKDVVLKPVTSGVFPLPAPRGKSEALINGRLRSMGMDNMRPWDGALKEYMEQATGII